MPHATATEIHAQLSHPVVDADGHVLESVPILADYVREHANAQCARLVLRLEPLLPQIGGLKDMAVRIDRAIVRKAFDLVGQGQDSCVAGGNESMRLALKSMGALQLPQRQSLMQFAF